MSGRVLHLPNFFTMKWLAILFALFIILIIVLADAGILYHYVGFVYRFPFGDKAGHFILYGILTLLINLSLFRSHPDQSRSLLAVKCGLTLALLIGLEEFSQQYFSRRTFDLVDLSFSYLGLVSFSWVALKTKMYMFNPKLKKSATDHTDRHGFLD